MDTPARHPNQRPHRGPSWRQRLAQAATAVALAPLLTACGGGGGGGSDDTAAASAPAPPASAGNTGTASAASCSPFSLAAGTTVRSVVANAVNPALAGTFTITARGPTTAFEGHQALEVDTTVPLLGLAEVTAQLYGSLDASGVLTSYGSVSTTRPLSGGTTTSSEGKTVLTPPTVDREFALAPGESLPAQTGTYQVTSTDTVNGVTSAPVTKTKTGTLLPATTFLGFETVTVPAGTYTACKYEKSTISNGVTTVTTGWVLAGHGGAPLKSSDGSVATSVTVNGVALTHD